MSRYIDADKAKELLKEYCVDNDSDVQYWYDIMGIDDCIDRIIPTADVVEADKAQKEIDYWHDKAQSYEQTILKLALNNADAVEVVRCQDCKYAEVADKDDSQDGYICQFHRGSIWFSGCYCSWGERADK